jgi:ankyrin repeat protein
VSSPHRRPDIVLFRRTKALGQQNPACLREVRPNGKRALSAAVKFGHREIARLLLERGADPNWPESDASRGASLHAAARAFSIEQLAGDLLPDRTRSSS